MDFSEALDQLKAGNKIQRAGWNGKEMFLFLVQGSTFKVNRAPLLGIFPEGHEVKYHPHIDMKAQDGSVFAWTPNNLDLLAEDWQVA